MNRHFERKECFLGRVAKFCESFSRKRKLRCSILSDAYNSGAQRPYTHIRPCVQLKSGFFVVIIPLWHLSKFLCQLALLSVFEAV